MTPVVEQSITKMAIQSRSFAVPVSWEIASTRAQSRFRACCIISRFPGAQGHTVGMNHVGSKEPCTEQAIFMCKHSREVLVGAVTQESM